jgi:hypothetical protein
MASYTAPPIPVPSRTARAAELVFRGVEQAGPSFEGRVFLNRPDSDETTPRNAEAGYAGSFHVYGYGEAAPPAIAEAKRSGAAGPVAPIEKRVLADDAALRAALADSDELTVTVVTIPNEPGGTTPERPFEDLTVLFDRATGATRQ